MFYLLTVIDGRHDWQDFHDETTMKNQIQQLEKIGIRCVVVEGYCTYDSLTKATESNRLEALNV